MEIKVLLITKIYRSKMEKSMDIYRIKGRKNNNKVYSSNIRIWYGHKTIKFISISFYCMVGITRHFSDVYSIFYRIDICWAISHSFFNFEELQKESYKDIGSYRADNIYGNRIYNYFYGHNSCKPHPSWTCLLIDNRCIQYNFLNIWYR